MNSSIREHLGWVVRESGSPRAERAVLLLPGALASAVFFDDMLAEPALSDSSIRFVATTLPGFGRTPVPHDLSIENYANVAGTLATDFGCEVVVGHSLGANIALEMAASGQFHGPLVLLSPSFSLQDESKFPRVLDGLSRVFGHLPYALMMKLIGPAISSSLPPHRRDALITELRNNDPRFLRKQTRSYLEYLNRHASLAPRLCESKARAWVVFGQHDDIGLEDHERAALESCPDVTLTTIADTGHFALNQRPDRIAAIVRDAVASLSHRR